PNSLVIDLSALVYNLRQVRFLIGQGARIMGVVKSDAYGHGLFPVSQILEREEIDCLGVAYLHEALELRKRGISLPIVILCGVRTRDECREVVEKDLTTVIFDLEAARILDQENARLGKKTHIHLKVDTGMGRLGVSYKETGSIVREILGLKNVALEAMMSHLSSADEPGCDFTEVQIRRFGKAVEIGRSMGLALPLNNLANSAAIMVHNKAHFEMVRPGIMLYGGLPSPGFPSPVKLRPAMNFTGQIQQIRDFADHSPISYGRTYYTEGPRRIAILSVGYGDGLPRSMSNKGKALIRGKKVPIVGRICMNLTACDITGLQDACAGDEAVLMGSQGREVLTGDDLAGWAGTISYEVFCSLGQCNGKKYLT
ncbi:MAG: alanine racemase, partial [Thermodesulfobacteriota bacterium]|nr:alanine racemase [Thermodesulfobacteriota bacterium]